MINQLLDLDQMKSGQVQLHLEQIDLNEIIVSVVQRIRPYRTRTSAFTFNLMNISHFWREIMTA